jgi:hypothetical protein
MVLQTHLLDQISDFYACTVCERHERQSVARYSALNNLHSKVIVIIVCQS